MAVPALSTAEIAGSLTALMRNFDRDGVTSRRLINELLSASPELFRDAAVQVLKTADDSRAVQCLIGVLVAHGLLLPVLCHPALSREQVLVVARIAQRVDGTAESAIAKGLADSVISNDPGVRPKDAGRLLEVLSEISDGSRILPSLMRLLRHPDPHLRSKAVKMIGCGTRNAKWVQGRLAETDPRVRANAIESLWGVDTPEARQLLQSSVHDGDNRVAGNALVALHRIGDSGVIADFFRLAAHDSQRFRVTAAWAMGEAADPRFSETLARMLRDGHPPVRTRALASLGRIKVFLAKTRQTNPWHMAGMFQDNPQRNLRRLQLAIADEDGGEYPTALGTHFQVGEDGQPVISYRAGEWQAPRRMSVVFVFPRSGGARGGAVGARRAELPDLETQVRLLGSGVLHTARGVRGRGPSRRGPFPHGIQPGRHPGDVRTGPRRRTVRGLLECPDAGHFVRVRGRVRPAPGDPLQPLGNGRASAGGTDARGRHRNQGSDAGGLHRAQSGVGGFLPPGGRGLPHDWLSRRS